MAHDIKVDLAEWLPAFMQTADPLFPTGAYAHSLGLEELVNLGNIARPADLEAFLRYQIGPSLAALELPYLRWAFAAAESDDIAALTEIDFEIDAWKSTSELRTASRSQGEHRLRILSKLWQDPRIQSFESQVRSQKTPGHQLTVAALQGVVMKAPVEAVCLGHGYQTLANFSSAAIKVMRIGQEQCQRILSASLADLPEWVASSGNVSREDAGWFAPTVDIASSRHATAFARLFIS